MGGAYFDAKSCTLQLLLCETHADKACVGALMLMKMNLLLSAIFKANGQDRGIYIDTTKITFSAINIIRSHKVSNLLYQFIFKYRILSLQEKEASRYCVTGLRYYSEMLHYAKSECTYKISSVLFSPLQKVKNKPE